MPLTEGLGEQVEKQQKSLDVLEESPSYGAVDEACRVIAF